MNGARDPVRQGDIWARRLANGAASPSFFIICLAFSIPLLLLLGYLQLTTNLAMGDDEGYMMAIVDALRSGGTLYDEVFSNHGPFFGLFWLSVAELWPGLLSHDGTRLAVLFLWIASSLLLTVSLYRLTRNVLFSLTSLFITFVVLTSLVAEPLHPVSLIAVILALMILVSTFSSHHLGYTTALGLGVLVGLMLLIKINMGLLVGAAVVGAFFVGSRSGAAFPPLLRISTLTLITFGPVGIMLFDLGEPLIQRFAFLVSAALISLTLVSYKRNNTHISAAPKSRWTLPGFFALGIVSTTGFVVGVALVLGVSVQGLFQGIFIEALEQRDTYSVPLDLAPIAVGFGALGLLLAILYRRYWQNCIWAIQILRLLGGSLILWAALDRSLFGILDPGPQALGVALPLVWVSLIGVNGLSSQDSSRLAIFPTVFLAFLAILAAVHVYPVAGNQLGVASFLLVPVGLLTLWRAWIEASSPATSRRVSFGLGALVMTFLLLMTVSVKVVAGGIQYSALLFRDREPLGLNGASQMRLDSQQSEDLRAVVGILRARCDTFYSLPGLNSFYFFADLPLATTRNASGWPLLFDEQQQARALFDLRNLRNTRLCIIRNRVQERAWQQGMGPASGPLVEFLTEDVTLIGREGDFEVSIKHKTP